MQSNRNRDEEDTLSDGVPEPKTTAKVKRKTLVGPWKTVEEYKQVYDWLFAPTASAATRKLALEEMRIWSLRRSSLCPAAVLATIVLLEVHLKDAEGCFTRQDLQTLYASAFTRFFNYMSSIMQSHNLRSMYDTAFQLGLPTFVVDLRHLCSHGQLLPPLEVLQSTTEFCVDWLHGYYWHEHYSTMSNVDASNIRRKDRTQFDENVTALFRFYDSVFECYLKGARDIKTAKRHLHGKRMVQLKEYYTGNALSTLRAAFDAIVKDLMFLVKNESGLKDLSEIYIEAFTKMSYFFTVTDKHAATNEDLEILIDITQGLFRMLAIQGFIDELFLRLISIAESSVEATMRRESAGFWALQIVKGFAAFRKCKQMYKAELDANPNLRDCDFSTLNFDNTSKRARKLLIYAGVDMKSTLIFGDSMRRPWVWIFDRSFVEERLKAINEYTAKVIKSLLTLVDPALKPAEIKILEELINVYIDECSSLSEEQLSSPHSTEDIHTAEDLLAQLELKNKVHFINTQDLSSSSVQKFGIWSTVPVDETQDWSICPLGRLPWE